MAAGTCRSGPGQTSFCTSCDSIGIDPSVTSAPGTGTAVSLSCPSLSRTLVKSIVAKCVRASFRIVNEISTKLPELPAATLDGKDEHYDLAGLLVNALAWHRDPAKRNRP